MSPRSPHFTRIKGDVLTIMSTVPAGKLVSFAAIGRYLDVMPRHVAYILAGLDPITAGNVPWHRAVPEDGRLKTPKADGSGQTQAALLRAEGLEIDPAGQILGAATRYCAIAELPHGVPQQTRPPEAALHAPMRKTKRAPSGAKV